MTKLISAIAALSLCTATLLYSSEADSNTANASKTEQKENQEKTFTQAVNDKNVKKVQKMLKATPAFVNLKVKGAFFSTDPIFLIAVESGSLEVVKLFLQSGADVNETNSFGLSPVLTAVGNDNLPMVKLLVEHGADVNAATSFGSFPLSSAVSDEQIPIVKFLIANGADVNMKNGKNSVLAEAIKLRNGQITKIKDDKIVNDSEEYRKKMDEIIAILKKAGAKS